MPQLHGNPPTGVPTWIDYMCADPQATGEFFSALLGWHVPPGDPSFGGYAVATSEGRYVSGFGPSMPEAGPKDLQSVYLATDDIEATVAKAKAAGATAMDFGSGEVMPIPGSGIMAVITDPAGAAVGLWQGKEHEGFGVIDEVGAPCWFECVSRDIAAARAFYSEVFGLEFTDDENYQMAQLPGGTGSFGLMSMPSESPEMVPSYWVAYYMVTDLDAAAEQVRRLGGQVHAHGEIESGRWLNATTPGGAFFGLYAAH